MSNSGDRSPGGNCGQTYWRWFVHTHQARRTHEGGHLFRLRKMSLKPKQLALKNWRILVQSILTATNYIYIYYIYILTDTNRPSGFINPRPFSQPFLQASSALGPGDRTSRDIARAPEPRAGKFSLQSSHGYWYWCICRCPKWLKTLNHPSPTMNSCSLTHGTTHG